MAERRCPVWVGYLLASPLRRLLHDPYRILAPYVSPGMRVLDVGCAMGFFSLPLARLVGHAGRVICVDVQAAMLERLRERAARAGLLDRLEARVCPSDSLGVADLAGTVGFALAFYVMHEFADAGRALAEVHAALKPGGNLLLAEPAGHVSAKAFTATLDAARAAGFRHTASPAVRWARAALLAKGPGHGSTA